MGAEKLPFKLPLKVWWADENTSLICDADDNEIVDTWNYYTIPHAAMLVEVVNKYPLVEELLKSLKEVVAISDRKHDAWDKAHAIITKAELALQSPE